MEKLGLYDRDGNYLNENVDRRNKLLISEGKYYKIVIVFIINNDGQFLIQKASDKKGNIYETLGGHVQDKKNSKDTIMIELLEELSIEVIPKNIKFFKKYIYNKSIQEVYYIIKNIEINKIIFQKDEVVFAKWFSIEEIKELIKNKMFRSKDIVPFLEIIESLKGEKSDQFR